ncbi:MAG: geranylgeranylglycerol-phosphate geranylgeranyltransferase [Paludibacteraceae bacterium]|nr:geranylgeranylglycerol-phosphate geranylgeranyltransferase [Paludibacteraceae bacterium]MBP6284914.1 geranylgeranylglycerol-phosphate geranylgeranyltransferase [Paludibacteraceae bacterium]
MKKYIQLLRVQNLLSLVLFQVLIYVGVVMAILSAYNLTISYLSIEIILLLVASVSIAAAGYVVNDYFDTKIDAINKPERVIVGKYVSRKQAAWLFQSLFVIGIGSGITLAILLKDMTAGFIFVVIPGLLWFYSASYKRQFLIGNIIVGLCAATAIFLVGYIQSLLLVKEYGALIHYTSIIPEIFQWVGGFSLFAFLLTVLREMVKDIEDVEGDKEMECRTVPIVWGVAKTKILVYAISVLSLGLLAYFAFFKIQFITDNVTERYFIFGIIMPFLAFFYLLFKAKTKQDYSQISTFLKFMMLIGVLYSVFVYYLFSINF